METKDILKQLRKTRGYSNAKDFCDASGISYNTYQNYEAGKRVPTADILITLADFYGVTTDYLLGREPVPDPLAGIHFKTVDNDEFVRLYSELPEQVKQIFVDTMAKLDQAQEQEKKKHSVRTGDLIDDEQAEETDAI